MDLFFDAVSSQGCIALFDENRVLCARQDVCVMGNESKQLPALIGHFLQENKADYTQLQNIVCVVGPGSFTAIRMITLIVNTLAYISPHISLTALSFFDLYDTYPIVKTSSKRDLFVKWEKTAIIEVLENSVFFERVMEYHTQKIYGNITNCEQAQGFEVQNSYDIEAVMKKIEFQKLKKVAPMYIKKPNIS